MMLNDGVDSSDRLVIFSTLIWTNFDSEIPEILRYTYN